MVLFLPYNLNAKTPLQALFQFIWKKKNKNRFSSSGVISYGVCVDLKRKHNSLVYGKKLLNFRSAEDAEQVYEFFKLLTVLKQNLAWLWLTTFLFYIRHAWK